MPTNMKARTVTCLTCHRDTETDRPTPVCLTCGANLITVVYSCLTGVTAPRVRVTGRPPNEFYAALQALRGVPRGTKS